MAKAKTAIQHQLMLKKRAEHGTRPVRRLRLGGQVPGVVYGQDMEPLAVSMNKRELSRILHSKQGEHALVTLRLDDGKAWEKPALVHAVQHHPVNGHVLHVDFHAILLTKEIKVKVQILLTGEPFGVKQEGGVLEHFLREVEVECLPTEIPAGVEFDVSAMKIGDTIHVKDLTPPKNAKLLTDIEAAVASVQKPKEEKAEEPAEAPTEPEVLREKKPEAEEAAQGEPAKAEKPAEGKKEK
jgi:large subunit ribosomal protein L25